MDFKNLLSKLDNINQKQLLTESSSVVEQALGEDLQVLKEAYMAVMERLHYKDIRALNDIQDDDERRMKLGLMAKKNGYPGLFDPVNGKFVDKTGQYAWFGAYKDEVERMEGDGLIPPKAQTSALLGMMGKDYDTAYGASKNKADRDDMIDTADTLIKKGKASYKEVDLDFAAAPVSAPVQEATDKFRSGLAQALTESFGYGFKQLVEGITRDEHRQLKDMIKQLEKVEGDQDVTQVLYAYGEYTKIRERLITRIRKIISAIQALRSQQTAPKINEDGKLLQENIYLFGDAETQIVSSLHLYADMEGNIIEYTINEDISSDISDTGRGIASGLTFGWSDNAVAGVNSFFKGTSYGEELTKELKQTALARSRSPVLFNTGLIAGGFLLPIPGAAGASLTANLIKTGVVVAGGMASDSYIRQPHNARVQADQIKKQNGQVVPTSNVSNTGSSQTPARLVKDPAVEKLQDLILKKDPKALPRFGADGKLGKETIDAAKRLGIALPNSSSAVAVNQPAAVAQASPAATEGSGEIEKLLLTKLGGDKESAIAKLKQVAGTDVTKLGDEIAKLLGIQPAGTKVATESIIFSSMSEGERMAYLRNRLAQLDETAGSETLNMILRGLERFGIATAERKAVTYLAKVFGDDATTVILKSGEKWTPSVGSDGKLWISQTGTVAKAEDLAGFVERDIATGWKPPVSPTPAPAPAPVPAPAPAPVPGGGVPAGTRFIDDAASGASTTYQKTATGWEKYNPSTRTWGRVSRNEGIELERRAAAKLGSETAPTPGSPAAAAAEAETRAVASKLAERFPKSAKVIQAFGTASKWAWSKKWWLAIAALIGWGYFAANTGSEQTPVAPENDPNNPNNPNHPNNPNNPNSPENVRKRQEMAYVSVLGELVKMLEEMFPDDKDAIDAVNDAKKFLPKEGSGQSPERSQSGERDRGAPTGGRSDGLTADQVLRLQSNNQWDTANNRPR